MSDKITIGRSADNLLVLKSNTVSSRHCLISRMADGTAVIEDLDSSNGTFLNGKRIKQAAIKSGDELILAGVKMDTALVLGLFDHPNLQPGLDYYEYIKKEQIFVEFRNLKGVYEEYQRKKKHIMKTNNLKNTGIKAGLSLIPMVGSALGTLSGTITGNVQEQLLELEEEFKRNYICPGCFKFLGAEPFENMEKRGYCLVCKAKWIK